MQIAAMSMASPSKPAQVRKMRYNGCKHGFMLIVGDTKFATRLLHMLGHGRIMNMTDPWKQMMFYLEIQSTQHPMKEFAVCAKIRG